MTLLVETRKIQRLGSSSLVVTLPKIWTRKNGLKPGDPIYLIDEGGHLKIMPGAHKGPCLNEELETKYNGVLREVGLSEILKCAYLNGYSRVRITYSVTYQNPDEIIEEAQGLSFVDKVVDELDSIMVYFKEDDGDPQKYLRRIFIEYHNLMETLAKSHETGTVDEEALEESVNTIRKLHDSYRLLINKVCQRAIAREGDRMSRHTATSLLGMLPLMLAGLARIVAKHSKDPVVGELIGKLRIAIQEAVGSYVSESMKRGVNYRKIKKSINGILDNLGDSYLDVKAKMEDITILLDELVSDSICLSLKNSESPRTGLSR